MRSRRLVASLALAASCGSAPQNATYEPAAPLAQNRSEPTPEPEPARLGPPWMPASEWTGPGIPPKQFSLFDVPARSPLLTYAAFDRDACESELQRRGIAFERGDKTPGVRAPVR